MLHVICKLPHLSVKSTYAFQLKLPCADLLAVPGHNSNVAARVTLATMLSTLRCSLFCSKPGMLSLIYQISIGLSCLVTFGQ